MKKSLGAAALSLVMVLWGVHLGYPLNSLQHARWTLFGYEVPVYYFFSALPMLIAAALMLTLKRGWTRWELAWCFLPLICLPGILCSSDPSWSVRQWISWVVRGVIPGGVVFLVADRERSKSILLYWVYPVIVAASLLGLAELWCNHNPLWDGSSAFTPPTSRPDNPFYRPYESSMVSGKPWGTQGNKIPYASTLVAFLPLGLWLVKYKNKSHLASLAAVAALFSILILAQVRSAWVGMLAAIVLMRSVGMLRDLRETGRIFTGAMLCLGLFLVWPKTHDMLWERLHSFHLSQSSIHARLEVLKTANILKDHWFLGVGFGQFPKECRSYFPSQLHWEGTPDNQYLRWVIENGALGFVLLSTFFAGLVHAGLKKIRFMVDVQKADFYRALLVGWLSIAVTFLFFDGFYWGACNMTFWCLLGMFATCLKPSSEELTT